MVCDGEKNGERTRFHRLMFNGAEPVTMEGTMAVFKSPHGTAKSPFRNCRPRGRGWMVMLQSQQEYQMYFEAHEHISNISFTADIDDFEEGDYITLRHDLPERIDYAQMMGKNLTDEHKRMVVRGEKLDITEWPTTKDEILAIESYDYMVDREAAPFSVYYSFNGNGVPVEEQAINWRTGEPIQATTNGVRHTFSPNFYKCFFKDCIEPEPAPPVKQPSMKKCPLKHCGLPSSTTFEELHVPANMHTVLDKDAMSSANYHFKWSSVFLSGTLEVKTTDLKDGDVLTIEVDHLVLNTPAQNQAELSARKRRDVETYDNGGLIIGTEDNPVPCGAKVIVKIGGDINSRSFGALPDSIPIGAKAIGGLGSIRMHGCAPTTTWTKLATTVNKGAKSITVIDDVSEWKVGDSIFIATSDFIKEHTEEFTIRSVSGSTIGLDKAVEWKHLGHDETKQELIGRTFSQAAEVGHLSRNIVLDGREGADEDDFGARVLITRTIVRNGHHVYVRSGVGQFDGVEFRGFGQKGADKYSDFRNQILFYDLNAGDEYPEVQEVVDSWDQSYVKNCAFNRGYHTAIAVMKDSNNILVERNVILGTVNDGIRTDSQNTVIKNNLVATVEHIALYKQYWETTVNANFNVDVVPAGINTRGTTSAVLEGNSIVGVDGSCYEGKGQECNAAEEACTEKSVQGSWKHNTGHACWNGYYLYRTGSVCQRVSNFDFYNMVHFGVLVYSHIPTAIVDSVIVADSKVGISSLQTGPTAIGHAVADISFTVKNSVVIGMSDSFDCKNRFHDYYGYGGVVKMHPPVDKFDQVAMMVSEFPDTKTGFPQSGQWDTDKDVVITGRTCVFDTAFSNFASKCPDVTSIVVSTQKGALDHYPQMTFEKGNSCTNCNAKTLVRIYRPKDKTVNPADCGDMHCMAQKRVMIVDNDGGIFGEAGTLVGESEYEWDGQTRGGVRYKDPTDGLGDFRIPAPMRVDMKGKKIPTSAIYTHAGVVRSPDCQYKGDYSGWFCPKSTGLEYYDLVYESMDPDHMTRILTPLAVRSEDKYLDLINSPADHTCCIGYACSMRLSTIHTTVACGKAYDYMFSSTLPISQRIHFAYAPPECKIRLSLYSKRPNRIKVFNGDQEMLPTNARLNIDTRRLEWERPSKEHIPDLAINTAGAHYQERAEQVLHVIVQGGSTLTLKVAQTLVLELSVMTELTEDEFYDNGNLARNLAALLGIDPSRIRVMNVISESTGARRRRHAEHGFAITGNYRNRREDADHKALQFEIAPEV